MAKIIKQDPKLQASFYQRIQDTHLQKKQSLQQEAALKHSFLTAWFFKWKAGRTFTKEQKRKDQKGSQGEQHVITYLAQHLPEEWTILNDIVLPPLRKDGKYVQIDHLVIGPSGIYVLETKAWRGTYRGHRNQWEYKKKGRWIKSDWKGPTQQNHEHIQKLQSWFNYTPLALDKDFSSCLESLVIFTEATIESATFCDGLVFDNLQDVAEHLQFHTQKRLSSPQIEALIQTLTTYAIPLCETCERPVTQKVKEYCSQRSEIFKGKVYCMEHQKNKK